MTDERLENTIGYLLRIGVGLAAAVVFAGGVWYIAGNASATAGYHRFQSAPHTLHAIAAMPGPEMVIMIGLLLLILTPIARVVFSLVAFALERDSMYVAMTAVVLAVLLYSIGTSWW